MVPLPRFLLLFAVCFTLFSCEKERVVNRGMYYWKSGSRNLEKAEANFLLTNKIQYCYVKFFEVETDDIWSAVPVAKTQLHFKVRGQMHESKEINRWADSTLKTINIIPTVYIENDVVIKLNRNELDELASNIVYLIDKYWKEKYKDRFKQYASIQIDCDWTPSSRDNYFYLLQKIKALNAGKQLSCTLRLYPYVYSDTMGVPPVDRATLMCYNLLPPLTTTEKNSILDINELEAYLKQVKHYPLNLDIALPDFSYGLLYQNNQFEGIFSASLQELEPHIIQVRPQWYEVKKDVVIGDKFLRGGDEIKIDEINSVLLEEAIAVIAKYVELDDSITVTLFDLNENSSTKYDTETINGFFDTFK